MRIVVLSEAQRFCGKGFLWGGGDQSGFTGRRICEKDRSCQKRPILSGKSDPIGKGGVVFD